MKQCLLHLLVVSTGFAATGPAVAGGPTVLAAEPAPAAAPTPAMAGHDWSGPYAGLAYGDGSGTMTYVGGDSRGMTGSLTSIFAGTLMQRGTLVYGGELALSQGNSLAQAGFDDENTKDLPDAKAKLRVAAGRALFYGVLGYSSATYDANPSDSDYDISGLSFGLGVDDAVSDRFLVGLEYLPRQTDADTAISGVEVLKLNSLSIRVGFSF
jgi:outer membrane immunogenic protein